MRYLICIIFLLFPFTVVAETLSGRVVGVSDGDTLTILDASGVQYKIRLAAIDAPEKAQPFGQKARQHLSGLCFNRQASVNVVDTDRYGRTVGEVDCEGVYANREMVRSGLAWVYRKHAKGYDDLYPLESAARADGLGLWSERNPTPPWEWRKANR